MDKNFPFILLFIFISPTSSSTYAEQEWDHLDDSYGIQIYSRSVYGKSYKEYKAEIIVDSPFEVSIELAKDYNNYRKWFGMCKELYLVKKRNEHDIDLYFAIDMPLVFDRDVVVSLKTNWDYLEGKGIADITNVDSKYKQNSWRVRIPDLHASFSIRRINPNKTKWIYTVYADAGGWIPAPVVDLVAKRQPNETMRGIVKQLSSEKYFRRASKVHGRKFEYRFKEK